MHHACICGNWQDILQCSRVALPSGNSAAALARLSYMLKQLILPSASVISVVRSMAPINSVISVERSMAPIVGDIVGKNIGKPIESIVKGICVCKCNNNGVVHCMFTNKVYG